MTREQRLKQTIWETVMEGTAHCGWTDRAREGLVQSVQDAVLWADHAAPAGDDGEVFLALEKYSETLPHAADPDDFEAGWNAARAHAPNSYQKDRNNAQNQPETQDVSRKVETIEPNELQMVVARATGGKKTLGAPRSQGAESSKDRCPCCGCEGEIVFEPTTDEETGLVYTAEFWSCKKDDCCKECEVGRMTWMTARQISETDARLTRALREALASQLTKTPDSVTSDPPSNVGESQGAELPEKQARQYARETRMNNPSMKFDEASILSGARWMFDYLASRPKAEGREFELIFDDDSDNPEVRVVSTTVFIKPNEVIHVREVGDV